MTIDIVDFNNSGAGVRWGLATGESLYLAESLFVVSTDNYALTATDSGPKLNIQGAAYGELGGVSLYNTTNANVLIGAHGTVGSDQAAFVIDTVTAKIINRGHIEGEQGFKVTGTNDFSVENRGAIDAHSTVFSFDGSSHGSSYLFNYGRVSITAQSIYAYQSNGDTTDVVVNSGVINGAIVLGDGSDSYFGQGAKIMVSGYQPLVFTMNEQAANLAAYVNGGNGNDTLVGGKYTEFLQGGVGKDTIKGGAGRDFLSGDGDADTITGGSGDDEFQFNYAADSKGTKADTIMDFSHAQKDKVDLEAIDANSVLANDQAFKFIGSKAFTGHAGELRFTHKDGDTYIWADIDGNKTADFKVKFEGDFDFVSTDFIL